MLGNETANDKDCLSGKPSTNEECNANIPCSCKPNPQQCAQLSLYLRNNVLNEPVYNELIGLCKKTCCKECKSN